LGSKPLKKLENSKEKEIDQNLKRLVEIAENALDIIDKIN
jgi:hypothetical protein